MNFGDGTVRKGGSLGAIQIKPEIPFPRIMLRTKIYHSKTILKRFTR
jgi:hypothetical protein